MDYQLEAKFEKSNQTVTFYLPITEDFHDFRCFGLKFRQVDKSNYDRCDVRDFRVYFNDVLIPLYECTPYDLENLMFEPRSRNPLEHFGLVPGHINIKIEIKVGMIERPVDVTLSSSIVKEGPDIEQYVYRVPMYSLMNYDLKSGENVVNCYGRNVVGIEFSDDSYKMTKIVCTEHKFMVDLECCPKGIRFFDHKYGLIPSMDDMPLSEFMESICINGSLKVDATEDCKLTVRTESLFMVVITDSNVMCVL